MNDSRPSFGNESSTSSEERQEVVEQVIERREVPELSYFIKVPLRPPPKGCRIDPRGKIRTVYPNSCRMTEDNESADVTEDNESADVTEDDESADVTEDT